MIETGIQFNDIHSFHDLDLILSGVVIPPATPKTNYIDIPGGDGSLDFTESTGKVTYNDRNCKFTFTMNPSSDLSESAFEEKKTEVSNLLNGKACKITLDKDDEYYYSGRCTVDEYASNKRVRQIVVSARVRPYKLKQNETVVAVALTTEEKTITLMNSRKPVVPVIVCTDDNTFISFANREITLSAGSHKVLDFCLVEGENIFKVSGKGTITLTYQEGDL